MYNLKFQPKLLFRDIAFRIIVLICIIGWATSAYFSFTLTNEPTVYSESSLMSASRYLLAPFFIPYLFSNQVNFSLAISHCYSPSNHVIFTAIFIVILFCLYLIGCGRFSLKRKFDKILFGLLAGAGLANCLEILTTYNIARWLNLTDGNNGVTMNFTDIVLCIAVPITVIVAIVRLFIYLNNLCVWTKSLKPAELSIVRTEKRWFLKAELAVLVCVACIWVFRSVALDLESVNAAVLKQVVKIDRDNVEAHQFLANYYDRSHDFEKAVEFRKQLVRIEPNNSQAWNDLGDEYASGGHYEEAIPAYKKAVQLDPNWDCPFFNLFRTYFDLHRYDEAIEECKLLVKQNPDVAGINVILAMVYSRAGQYENAILACKQTLQLDPNSSLAHYHLSKAYLRVGNKDLALKEYEILETLDAELAAELFADPLFTSCDWNE